ncbi:MAG: hypothetical protein R3C40_07985 [Parvularculaceae bacterium]
MKAATFLLIWAGVVLIANIFGWTSMNAWSKIAFSPLTYEFIAGAIIALIIKMACTHTAMPRLPSAFASSAAGNFVFATALS